MTENKTEDESRKTVFEMIKDVPNCEVSDSAMILLKEMMLACGSVRDAQLIAATFKMAYSVAMNDADHAAKIEVETTEEMK